MTSRHFPHLPKDGAESMVRVCFAPIIFALLLCVSIAGFALKPQKLVSKDAEAINIHSALPQQFGDWRVEDGDTLIVKSAAAAETLDRIYDQHLARTYVNRKGQRVMVGMAYGSAQTQQLRVHRQEVCYTAQGFQVSQLKREPISVGGKMVPATTMVASRGSRVEPVTYWFTMGDTVVLSYMDRQWQQLRYGLSGYIPDGYLFRVSTLSSDPYEGFMLQRRFADELLAAMDIRLARRLLGMKETKRVLAEDVNTKGQAR